MGVLMLNPPLANSMYINNNLNKQKNNSNSRQNSPDPHNSYVPSILNQGGVL